MVFCCTVIALHLSVLNVTFNCSKNSNNYNGNFCDISYKLKKSPRCIRIGQSSNVICQRLCSVSGTFLQWSTEIKYLGVHIVGAKSFKVSTDQCRRSFYRATNAIFGRVSRTAAEEVVIHLIVTKCLPVLLYCLEACPLRKTDFWILL